MKWIKRILGYIFINMFLDEWVFYNIVIMVSIIEDKEVRGLIIWLNLF